MKYFAYCVRTTLLVHLVLVIAHGTITLRILAHPAIQSLCKPDKGCQRDGDGKVFHSFAGSFWANWAG